MNPLQLMQMLTSLQSNPIQFLTGRGFNIPQGLTSPEAMVNHLVKSGQVNQNTINMAMETARQMGVKL